MKITIINNVRTLFIIKNIINKILEDNNFSSDTNNKIIMIISEIINNIYQHSETNKFIDLNIYFENQQVFVKISNTDKQFEFKPKSLKSFKNNYSGAGIHILKKIVNNISYEYIKNKNIISFNLKNEK